MNRNPKNPKSPKKPKKLKNLKDLKHVLIAIALLCASLCTIDELRAQDEPPDPIEYHTFPPELVMQHQRAIELTSEQRGLIKTSVLDAQARFTDLQWDLEAQMETFVDLLALDRIDERKALTVLETILALESDIKQTHLTLVIRIKNVLTPEQQAWLRVAREQGE